MTALLEGARRLTGRGGSDLVARMDALQRAVEASSGRLDPDLVAEANEVLGRAGARLRLSAEHTVVALAGATGSGKSSVFNAVAGLELSAVGVRRPTTAATMACVWGAEGAGELLDWLGVPKRHQVERESPLDAPSGLGGASHESDLRGLVLLDLPDHDSTEVAHHVEVDRLVRLADLMVWVLDPQKYADAAIHQRYLEPLASHQEVMVMALNHIDTVAPERRPEMLDDLRRLLAEDGLDRVPVLVTSARTGEGLPPLRELIASRVAAKKVARSRLSADVSAVASRMRSANGDAQPGDVARRRKQELVGSFADAAGVPIVVRAVERSTKVRARQATGWPLTAWLGRLKPDPLKRLHLGLGKQGQQGKQGKQGQQGRELTVLSRASVPQATAVQRARVDSAVRAVADDVSAGLPQAWTAAVRRASVSRLPDLNDALDKAVTSTDLGVDRRPAWWGLVRVVQWVLILTALAGGLWLGGLAVMGYFQLPVPETPDYRGFAVPSLMLLGGVLAGIALAWLSRILAGIGARAKASSADRRLRAAISDVTERLVVEPIGAEVEAYRATRDALAKAAG
ncbi:MAG: putative ATP-binding membrane protein [uncultured Nocardioidaceae bacterium]|uniref:Putative ATP-binding membrane protein n=1 Tax=uncultured Nocardioidaceae bacterium TaxID=253824 RepID=A0A6J4LLE8_9ACTN|nr:MAG: putative ATP-binding membrane protein [uncultured Nocardioidaceae bacterium]